MEDKKEILLTQEGYQKLEDELEILKVELEKSTSNLEVRRKSYEQKLIELPLLALDFR